jgi:hypothetical protein
MIFKLNSDKKIFIACAIITAAALCAYSLFLSLSASEKMAEASSTIKKITIQPAAGSYQIGQKYALSWDSDCRGGEVMVWLSTASSSKANIGILVPLLNFSAVNFGDKGKDDRIFFPDPWKFITSQNVNNGKTNWIVPAQLNLAKSLFKSDEGVFYIYALADGRIALHKIVEQPVQMPVMPDNYYLRIDIKGKNGCTATGYSAKINIVAK